MYNLRPKTNYPKSDLPVTQEELLAYVQVDVSEWQPVVLPLLLSAMDEVEAQTKQAIFSREWELITDNLYDGYCLPGCYVTEVKEITVDGEEVNEGAYELIGDYLLLFGSFPHARNYYGVTYKRGFPADFVPDAVKQALKILVREWYDNRGDNARNWPTVVDKLLKNFKTHKTP